MKWSAWAVLAAVAMVGTVLSGCLTEGGDVSFGSLDAPVWEPGFTWSYETVSEGTFEAKENGATSKRTGTFTAASSVEVFNTTATVEGDPVYWIRGDGETDDDFFTGGELTLQEGRAQAMRASDLAPVAAAWSWGNDACGFDDGHVYDAQEPSPFRFPLKGGQTWSFREDGIRFEAKVHGLEQIKTQAGTFEAVRIHHKITAVEEDSRVEADYDEPMSPDVDESYDYEQKFTVERDLWYSPEVRYIVKIKTTTDGYFREGDESFTVKGSSVVDLTSYSLTAAPADPAPTLRDPFRQEWEPRFLRIVSDTEFPANVADGPVAARFTLENSAAPSGGWGELTRPSGDFVAYAEEDAKWLSWYLERGNGEMVHLGNGAVIEHTFEAAERAYISVEVMRPSSSDAAGCGYERPMRVAPPHQALVPLYWERSYDIDVEQGTMGEVLLDDLFIGEGGRLIAQWSMKDDTPYVLTDDASPLLRHAEGFYEDGSDWEGAWETWPAPGPWRLYWDVRGVNPGDGPFTIPTAAGHTAELTLRIDYE